MSHITPDAFKSRDPSPVGNEDKSLPCFSLYADPLPLLKSKACPKEVTSQNIKEVGSLGVSQFGLVVLAETVRLSLRDLDLDDRKGITIQVAVKKLKVSAEPYVKEAFEKEIKFMSLLRCKNMVRLLGVCPAGDHGVHGERRFEPVPAQAKARGC